MSSIIRCRSGLTVLVSLMESSFLIEVDNTSILRTGALHCYHYTLNRLPAPRLLLPRSGLEHSVFVPWCSSAFLAWTSHLPVSRREVTERSLFTALRESGSGPKQRSELLFRPCQRMSRHLANGP